VRDVNLQQQDPVAEPRPEERLRDQAAHLDRFPVVATQPDRTVFMLCTRWLLGLDKIVPIMGT
jgi:hypothetical protein